MRPMPRLASNWNEFGKNPEPHEALKSGDLTTALTGFATEHLLEFRHGMNSDGPAVGFGTTLWLMGDVWGAGMIWSKVCDEAIKGRYPYSSLAAFQGGLLLRFASVRLKDEDWHCDADRLFEKLLRKKQPVMDGRFPSRLAKLLRREIELAQVEEEYSDVPLLRERRETQALFYAGVGALEDGSPLEALRLWQQVKEPKNSLVELEYYLLVHERRRLEIDA